MKADDVACVLSLALWLLLIVLGPIFGPSLGDDRAWSVTVIWSLLQLVATVVALSGPRASV